MTDALCFGCGNIKFGAWCPCHECRTKSSGDKHLDLIFSDPYMSLRNLEDFGEFLKLLKARCEDRDVCFWAFMSYVSTCQPSVLKATTPEALAAKVEVLLAGVEIPKIELEPGLDYLREKARAEKRINRKWWQFWR